MQFSIVDNQSDFAELKQSWDNLESNPLKSFAWNFSWWNEFGLDDQLQVFCGYDDKRQLVGLAPMFADRWLSQKRLRFIGSGTTCTDYARLIASPQHRESFATEFVHHIASSPEISMVEFEGVVAEHDEFLREQLQDHSYWQYNSELEPTWKISLPATWEEFQKNSKKSLRRKIKKALSRLSSSEFQIRSSADDVDFDEAFATLVELHQDRFTSKGEPGVFKDERFARFLNTAAAELVATERAEILIAEQDGTPIIAQLYLLDDSGPQLYQAGIRTSAMKSEPGHLLFTFAVRQAIERGYSTFDFLRGNESYKPYWGAQVQPLSKIRCVSKRLVPSTINKSFQWLRSAKHLVSSFIQKKQTEQA